MEFLKAVIVMLNVALMKGVRKAAKTNEWILWIQTATPVPSLNINASIYFEMIDKSNKTSGKIQLTDKNNSLQPETINVFKFVSNKTGDLSEISISYDNLTTNLTLVKILLAEDEKKEMAYIFDCNCSFSIGQKMCKIIIERKAKIEYLETNACPEADEASHCMCGTEYRNASLTHCIQYTNDTEDTADSSSSDADQEDEAGMTDAAERAPKSTAAKDFLSTSNEPEERPLLLGDSSSSSLAFPAQTIPATVLPSSSLSCRCACDSNQTAEKATALPEDRATELGVMLKDMKVNKKDLSSYIRKKTSASDNRPSAVVIGGSGVVLLVTPFAVIVLSDLFNLSAYLRTRLATERFP